MKTTLLLKTAIRGIVIFSIAISISPKLFSQDYGKTYVDISRGTAGGTIQPGDTLEIRATFVVKSGTGSVSVCSFKDVVPSNTTYIPGTLRVLTNEGLIFRQFTDAPGDDPGTILGTNITINLGTGATALAGGTIKNTDKPNFSNSCIMVASYRIVIQSVPFGTKISVGRGNLSYKASSNVSVTFSPDSILLYQNYGMCSNAVGSNAILSEFGGTFGSGNAKDRAASSSVPSNYTYTQFSSTAYMPNDYYYGVSNNTSGGPTPALGYSTVNTWPVPDNSQNPSHRVFSTWDIIGDHTGASNPLLGNPPTDDLNGASGGYMLVVNSSYRTDTAFLDTVSNLCPNTYYQYSAWIRNIVSKGSTDSNGVCAVCGGPYQSNNGDSSGVHPNLTFNVNGADYYTTGDMPWTGQWVLKGFMYKTGPTETSMIINIRNNAPGGGGNDWAIDDISVASCVPNIAAIPGKPDTLCQGADDTVRFKVSSYFNNYTEWKIEQSFDNGVTWTALGNDTLGAASTGSATPVYNSSTTNYEYTVTRYYRLDNIHTLTQYRILVASTAGNLSSTNCVFGLTTPQSVYGANCNVALPVSIVYFNGWDQNGYANLKWQSENEPDGVKYVVERSTDYVNFEAIGSVNGGSGVYTFVDPKPILSNSFYRIRIVWARYEKLSPVIVLSNADINFEVMSILNPFQNQLSFQVMVPNNDVLTIHLVDLYGRIVSEQKQAVTRGLNYVGLNVLKRLPTGMYALMIQYKDKKIVKMVLKN